MKHSFSNVFRKTWLPASLLLLTSTASMVSAADLSTKEMEIHDAWTREAPPSTEVMAAYLTLHNHTAKTFTLVSVSSPDFNRVEMHRTEEHDGMMKMLPVSRVMISSNGSVSFQPGGMHLMLMKPKKALKNGDTVSLKLMFSDKSSLKTSVPVKKGTAGSGHEMHHGDHHDMHDDNHQSKHESTHDSMHESSHDMHDKKNNKNHHDSHTH